MSTDILGMAEAAAIVGISKSNFTSHREKFNGEGQCPAPTIKLTCGPIWFGKDAVQLRRWAKEWGRMRTTRSPRRSSEEIAAEKAAKEAAAAKVTKAPAKKAAAKSAPAPAPAAPVKPVAKKLGSAKKAPAVARAVAKKTGGAFATKKSA